MNKVHYVVYDKASGSLYNAGYCDPEMLVHRAGDGQIVLPVDAGTAKKVAHRMGHFVVQDGTVVEVGPSRAEVKTKAAIALHTACHNAIVGSFKSGGFTYPSLETDQQNLFHASLVGGALHRAKDGVWSLDAHGADEAKAVLADFVKVRDAARLKLDALLKLIDGAETAEQAQAVTWEESAT